MVILVVLDRLNLCGLDPQVSQNITQSLLFHIVQVLGKIRQVHVSPASHREVAVKALTGRPTIPPNSKLRLGYCRPSDQIRSVEPVAFETENEVAPALRNGLGELADHFSFRT